MLEYYLSAIYHSQLQLKYTFEYLTQLQRSLPEFYVKRSKINNNLNK